jgi:hypothetical protein
MEPEEMDVVELLEDVAVDPSWRVKDVKELEPIATLAKGQRGMVVHRRDENPPTYDVEFVDSASLEPIVLATLPGAQLRVVERDTLAIE